VDFPKKWRTVKRNNDRDRKEADERREIQHKIDWND